MRQFGNKRQILSFTLCFKFFNIELQIYSSCDNNTKKRDRYLLSKIIEVHKMPWKITILFYDI